MKILKNCISFYKDIKIVRSLAVPQLHQINQRLKFSNQEPWTMRKLNELWIKPENLLANLT